MDRSQGNRAYGLTLRRLFLFFKTQERRLDTKPHNDKIYKRCGSVKICFGVRLTDRTPHATLSLGVTCRDSSGRYTVSAGVRHPLGNGEGAGRNTARISAKRRAPRR